MVERSEGGHELAGTDADAGDQPPDRGARVGIERPRQIQTIETRVDIAAATGEPEADADA